MEVATHKQGCNVKIVNFSLLACALVLPSLGFAKELPMAPIKKFDWDFIAPSIYDTANLPAAASGLIVYDSKTDSFYAKGPMGLNDWRSFSQGTNFNGNVDLGTCVGTKVVDWSQGNSFTVTLTNADTCVFDFDNASGGQSITIWVTNAATTGSGETDWQNGIKWQGGEPAMTQGAGKLDVCTFTSNGAAVAGSCIQDMQ
jgi:hypothetical protein